MPAPQAYPGLMFVDLAYIKDPALRGAVCIGAPAPSGELSEYGDVQKEAGSVQCKHLGQG